MEKFGINEGLSTLDYKLIGIKRLDLFTHIFVEYNEKEILNKWFKASPKIKK